MADFGPFVGLNRMSAQTDALRSQAALEAQKQRYLEQQYAAERAGKGYFGGAMMDVYGQRQMPMPGGAPMPPQPGEASMPGGDYSGFQQPGPAFGGPQSEISRGLPAPTPPPAQVAMQGIPKVEPDIAPPQMAQQEQGKQITLQDFFAAVKAKHPDADPVAVAEAANYFLPFLTQQDRGMWERADAQTKLKIAQMTDERSIRKEEAVQGRFDRTQDRLLAGLDNRIEVAKQKIALAERAGNRAAAREERLRLGQLSQQAHNRIMEIAAIGGSFGLDKDTRAEMIEESKARYAADQAVADEFGAESGQSSPRDPARGLAPKGRLDLRKKVAPVPLAPKGEYRPDDLRIQ